jgi:hypothetical protein
MKKFVYMARGQGVVKASQIGVKSAVDAGGYGQFIPFFRR